MPLSACLPWPTETPGQTAGERNEAAGSYTTSRDTIRPGRRETLRPSEIVVAHHLRQHDPAPPLRPCGKRWRTAAMASGRESVRATSASINRRSSSESLTIGSLPSSAGRGATCASTRRALGIPVWSASPRGRSARWGHAQLLMELGVGQHGLIQWVGRQSVCRRTARILRRGASLTPPALPAVRSAGRRRGMVRQSHQGKEK
jgi:hypothetical protein